MKIPAAKTTTGRGEGCPGWTGTAFSAWPFGKGEDRGDRGQDECARM